MRRRRFRVKQFLARHPFDIDQWLAGTVYVLLAVLLVVLVAFIVRWGPTLAERLQNGRAVKPCVVVHEGHQP